MSRLYVLTTELVLNGHEQVGALHHGLAVLALRRAHLADAHVHVVALGPRARLLLCRGLGNS